MQEYLTGNIVIEGESAQLQLEDGSLITLDNSYLIEVLNGTRFETATISKMLQAKDEHGWSIYCGLYATAKRGRRSNRLVEISQERALLAKEVVEHVKAHGGMKGMNNLMLKIEMLMQEQDAIIKKCGI